MGGAGAFCAVRSHASGGAAAAGAESARTADDPLRELPHEHELGADTGHTGIQSRQHAVSVAWDARESIVHGMPSEAGVHGCREAVRELSRGHTPGAVRGQLRAVPHGAGMAGIGAIDFAALQPVSAAGGARGGGMPGVP